MDGVLVLLQRSEMRKLEADDQLLMKERNYTYAMLDKLLCFRKSNFYLLGHPDNLTVMRLESHSV